MKKEYTVRFKNATGEEFNFTFITENIDKSIKDYCRNRQIVAHEILGEGTNNNKQMLFG